MNDKEQRRGEILSRFSSGSVTACEAARLLGVCVRQVRRLRRAFVDGGLQAAVHGNKGRRPSHAISSETIAQITTLTSASGPYHDFNACHTQELLKELHDIEIGRSTLQRLLEAGRAAPAKPGVVHHRRRRDRHPAEGMLVQIDGSPHDWFEGRSLGTVKPGSGGASKSCLMGAIDDATSKVLYLHFQPSENAAGYLRLFRQVGIDYGLPMGYYHDKHTILRSPKQATIDDELAGRTPMSQVQRVLDDLGVKSIAAHSPQAKGRIERLWGTLQDRLVKEMRLAGVSDHEAANAFLPKFIKRFNKRFAKAPEDAQPVWVPLAKGFDVDYSFSVHEVRTVRADHTVSFDGQVLQICPASRSRSLAGEKVTVRTNPEGSILIYDGKRRLAHRTETGGATKAVPVQSKQNPAPILKPADPAAAARRRGFLYAQP